MQFPKKLAFTEEEYRRRLDVVRRQMAQEDLDAIIVWDPRNIRYLSGFCTVAYWDLIALIVTHDGDPIHFIRDIEARNVEVLSWTPRWVGYSRWKDLATSAGDGYTRGEDPATKLKGVLEQEKLDKARIGIEKQAWFLSVYFYEVLLAALPDVEFVGCSGLVDRVRFVKSPQELAYIRQAARATVAGMQAAIDACEEGKTETHVAAAVYHAMILTGSERPAIPPMISAGYRTSLPHATWEGKRLERGDIVFAEFSGCVKGYHAPLARNVVIGDCADEQKRLAQVSIDALEAALAAVKPGVSYGDVRKAARDVIRKAGMDDCFGGAVGYSLGVGFPPYWGEHPYNPMMLEGGSTVLETGMVFSMVPDLENDEWADRGGGHFDISSTIAVTEDGYELITDFPRRLFYK